MLSTDLNFNLIFIILFYITLGEEGFGTPDRETLGYRVSLRVNVVWMDLFSFTFILLVIIAMSENADL